MAHKIHLTLRAVFLLILIYIVPSVLGTEEEDSLCPHYGVKFRGRCFWFVDVATTWYEAGFLCHRLYGDHVTLATIKDDETNDFIRSQSHKALWIGLHEAEGETIWRWVDNTELANESYQEWLDGTAPTSQYRNNNCALLKQSSHSWIGADCGSRQFFVCAESLSAPICPNGGIFFRDRCYWRGNRELSFADADQACQDDFGPEIRLAVSKDAETNLFLTRLAGRTIWIGLTNNTEGGVWKWIDGTTLDFERWGYRQPDNWMRMESCAELQYPTGVWNDVTCGNQYFPRAGKTTNTRSYICAIPPCYERSGDVNLDPGAEDSASGGGEIRIVDSSICARTNCNEKCVNGGVCNSTGQCVCVHQFPGMTCNLDNWEVEIANEIISTSTGSILTLKCKVNLPAAHISSLTWTKSDPGFLPLYRHNITDQLSQGYSVLEVFSLTVEDAGKYQCNVLLKFKDIELPVTKTAEINITAKGTPPSFSATSVTTQRTSSKDSPDTGKYDAQKPARGLTALIVILFVMTSVLLVTVVVLSLKLKRAQGAQGWSQIEHSLH